MSLTRRYLRPSLIAFAAIFGASLTVGGAAHGGTAGGGTCDPQSPSTCCVARPKTCNSGCCPSRASVTHRTGTDRAGSEAGESPLRLACNPFTCQCRSNDPAVPAKTSDRLTTSDRSETGAWAVADRLGQVPSESAVTLVDPGGAGRLRVPLYLLTTHLRF